MEEKKEYTLYFLYATNAVKTDGEIYEPGSRFVFIGAFREKNNAERFVKTMKCDEFDIEEKHFKKDYFVYDGEVFEDNWKFEDEK